MNQLRVALGLLTILPLGPRRRLPDAEVGGALVWFPLVGVGIGWGLVLVYQAAAIWFPSLVTSVLVVITLVVLTGALHLDGVADLCDALAGGRTPADRLRLMKDPHIGAVGVVGLVCVLLLKVALLAGLPSSVAGRALLVMPTLGRCAMVVLATTLPYARTEGGTAGVFVAHGRRRALPGALGLTVAVSAAAFGVLSVWVLAAAALLAAGVGAACRRLLGGITGDALGAAGELVEVVALAVMVVLSARLF